MEKKPSFLRRHRRVLALAMGVICSVTLLYFKRHKRVEKVEEIDLGLRLSKLVLPTASAKQLSLELGVRLVKKRDFEGAKKIFDDMLMTDPTNLSVLNNLAYIAGEQGQVSKAVEYLQTAIQISEKCAECFNNLGAAYYKEGKTEEARQMYLKSITIDGKYADPKLNLAVLYEEQSDWASALDWYRQAQNDITDPELKSWVEQRSRWMSEISHSAAREVANQK